MRSPKIHTENITIKNNYLMFEMDYLLDDYQSTMVSFVNQQNLIN